jgi:RND superfamily putative drug exporter
MVLVPATMSLLGDANWWIPKALDGRFPRLVRQGKDLPSTG